MVQVNNSTKYLGELAQCNKELRNLPSKREKGTFTKFVALAAKANALSGQLRRMNLNPVEQKDFTQMTRAIDKRIDSVKYRNSEYLPVLDACRVKTGQLLAAPVNENSRKEIGSLLKVYNDIKGTVSVGTFSKTEKGTFSEYCVDLDNLRKQYNEQSVFADGVNKLDGHLKYFNQLNKLNLLPFKADVAISEKLGEIRRIKEEVKKLSLTDEQKENFAVLVSNLDKAVENFVEKFNFRDPNSSALATFMKKVSRVASASVKSVKALDSQKVSGWFASVRGLVSHHAAGFLNYVLRQN